ncbi:MAG TPA: hypothetical protein VFZ16_16275 [Hyphomicrobiaceae bacterium]|nr:hypothetical protein [Hyphomicrobiaceae bacterium]
MFQSAASLLLMKVLPFFILPLGMALALILVGAVFAWLYFLRIAELCLIAATAIRRRLCGNGRATWPTRLAAIFSDSPPCG